LSLSVTITRGTYRKPFSSLRQKRLAAVALRRLWTRMSRTFLLVDRAPKAVLLAADADEHFVQVPLVARLWPAPLQHVSEDPTKAQAPLANALIADDDPTRHQDQLDFAKAQTEAVIKPHGMLDDLRRKAEAAMRVWPSPEKWTLGYADFASACSGVI
jgi:hypothetical protein